MRIFNFPFYLLLLLALWSAAAPASAVAQDQPRAAVEDQAEKLNETIDKARTDLAAARGRIDALKQQVAAYANDDARLVDLKAEVEEATRTIIAISVSLRPRFEAIKSRLAELGDPPAEGQPPEADIVTSERKQLGAERSLINALTGEAEDLSISATSLSNQITDIRRRLFTETLFKRSDISVDSFNIAGKALVAEMADLQRAFGSWIKFVWKFKRLPLLTAVLLSLFAAMIFLVGSYRLFGHFTHRDRIVVDPPYIARLSFAFWSTMIQTLSLVAFLASSFFFMNSFNVLRADIAPIISSALGFTGAVYFVGRLTHAVFAPGWPDWRLVRVSNTGAHQLDWAILAMAFVSGVDYVFSGISEALGSPVILTVMKSFAASLVVGLILFIISFLRPVLAVSGDPEERGRPWPRPMAILLRLTGIALVVACVTGYVGLARFVATQIVLTGAVVATMYIGILCGKAVGKRGAFAETRLGVYLGARYGLGPVALDQIGLAAGLGVYVFALMTGVPLILLSWGFQVGDLEQWAYRLFTEIRIGNISISLMSILGGVLLFVFGLLMTRWLQKWIDGNVMDRSQVDAGVRNSVKTGVGYLGVAVAGLIGISAAGLDLSSFALVAGALSLGVGFGLQNIVSNFVSGLILLVERPFKVGDWVVTGTTEGFVKRISVRATEIETFQRQSIMVPNSLFINASVGNWTHRNKLGRADISVVVSYDSDPRRIMQLLKEIAEGHPKVLRNPAPMAIFSAFGEATMTFELRAYLADIVNGGEVRNDLRLAIFERFRQEGLGMPFKKEDGVPKDPPEEDETREPLPEAKPEPRTAPVVNAQSGKSIG
ncbi:MAG: mechanosensitive ion channel protein [Rhizobium sp. 63-7]|nr:MAG: mechanosensitive ion channel protein [Rhizobium sp. 63-7]